MSEKKEGRGGLFQSSNSSSNDIDIDIAKDRFKAKENEDKFDEEQNNNCQHQWRPYKVCRKEKKF